jgi:very-short-patch-repair endonuclease
MTPKEYVRRLEAKAKRDKWADKLRSDLRACGIQAPALVEEYRFSTARRFRFDFAIPTLRVAIEVEGGVHADPGDKLDVLGGKLVRREGKKSRHTTSEGYERDCEKYNLAQLCDWWVLRFTPNQIKNGYAATCVEEAVKARKGAAS